MNIDVHIGYKSTHEKFDGEDYMLGKHFYMLRNCEH
jgi:hypothetical protein